jgi:2-amino-4-hydroxy-6-hydroxymethyldihydropteridine diphosphokinase
MLHSPSKWLILLFNGSGYFLKMPIAYFITGGNQGDRRLLLRSAEQQIMERVGVILRSSPVYESEAWGFSADQNFLNQVIVVETTLSAEQIILVIRQIETALGRRRGEEQGYSSRTMDIDLLFYNREIIQQEDLIVPHPRIQLRRFVLQPLVSINPGLIHPGENKTVWDLLRRCSDKGMVREYRVD